MLPVPLTEAEKRAEAATRLPAFPINLYQIRGNIQIVLSEWKSTGFFQEYTDHTFSHVIDMLNTLEWIIPQDTKLQMTPADWLLIVLAIYFHDLGLLVSRSEFEKRKDNSDFKSFLQSQILTSEKHDDFVARLAQLSEDEADRMRYQEFVRLSHGKRVRAWVEGAILDDNDATNQIRKVVNDLLDPLDLTVRRDLALVCESHTLGDVDDVSKYKLSQPYGDLDETVNLQYCAIILRTLDLLQITKRRAPSVLFQLINPSDPVSQVEWQKQGAVRTVRPAPGRDREGKVSNDAPSDTIEVHATFKEPDGFFGLTSYLNYAERQISRSFTAIQKSSRNVAKPYSFPWRRIDTTSIDTTGFLTKSFEFELDQHKILDLLTGHTLYNDTRVVLRELTQNALDAVRLQSDIDEVPSESCGIIDIVWREADRTLTVSDNGTGMSQEVIESHLLKVGSSRYQDAKFKETHPDFHSISRFGIGVLSAFMVSDHVEITICSKEDDEARRITLRSVHGKYLIKLLNKISNRDQLRMYPHGTSVRLVLRPTAEVGDVLKVARSWLMFPRCRVRVTINNEEPVLVGYASPKEALTSYLQAGFGSRSKYKTEYDVKEFTEAGVTLAFAVAKDELFQDWGFTEVSEDRRPLDEDEIPAPIATCIEGVAVELSTPGFSERGILAVANAVGPDAPRTNVARSALEDTSEQRKMLQTVYRLYARHVTSEINRLRSGGSHSLSRAVGVAPFIATPLLARTRKTAVRPTLLTEAVAEVPLVLVEDEGGRRNISLADLSSIAQFWTIESPLYRSIEYFVKETSADITTRKVLSTLGNITGGRSAATIVCNLSSTYVDESIRSDFYIDEIVASEEAREIELRWSRKSSAGVWLHSTDVYYELIQKDLKFWRTISELRQRFARSVASNSLNVPGPSVKARGLGNAGSFIVNQERYLRPGTSLADLFLELNAAENTDRPRVLAAHFILIEAIRSFGWSWDLVNLENFDQITTNLGLTTLKPYIPDHQGFVRALQATGSRVFDPFAWDRRGAENDPDIPF